MTWRGKRFWIVGASEGLGRAIAHELSNSGVELVLSARSVDRLETLTTELPGKSIALQMDVSNADSVKAAAEQVGIIDGLIYAAGTYSPMSADNWNADAVDTMCDINFTGAVRVLGHVVPDFTSRDTGHIVLIGSLAGFRGLPNAIGYSASKAALMHLGQTLYADLRKSGTKIQVINPGFVKTRLTLKNDFPMPFIMSPENAAKRTVRSMGKPGFEYSFPKRFAAVFHLARLLPEGLYYRLFS